MTKSTSLICFVMPLLISVPVAFAENEPGADFVMANQPSGEPYDWRKTRLPEKPWRRLYHEIITTKLLLCKRNGDGSVGEILFTFEQALEVIRRLHSIVPELDKDRYQYRPGWRWLGRARRG